MVRVPDWMAGREWGSIRMRTYAGGLTVEQKAEKWSKKRSKFNELIKVVFIQLLFNSLLTKEVNSNLGVLGNTFAGISCFLFRCCHISANAWILVLGKVDTTFHRAW